MDYGHTNLPDNSPEFSTPDNFEANNNLDLTNPETSWDQPVSIEHNKKALGSEALANSLEMPPSPEQELGKPIPYSTNLDPITQPANDMASDAEIAQKALDIKPEPIKTTEYLNDEGIKAVESLNERLMQGEISLDDYYDFHQDITEANLQNSFDRKIGEKTEEKEAA